MKEVSRLESLTKEFERELDQVTTHREIYLLEVAFVLSFV